MIESKILFGVLFICVMRNTKLICLKKERKENISHVGLASDDRGKY